MLRGGFFIFLIDDGSGGLCRHDIDDFNDVSGLEKNANFQPRHCFINKLDVIYFTRLF